MPLDEKSRLKLDKVFMTFGSIMKAMDRTITDAQVKAYADAAWMWSIRNVYQLVDELYQMSEKAGTQPPPPQQPQTIPGETTVITVKAFAVQSQGQRKDGTPWTRYQVKDGHGINYYTFHSSYALGESYEIDWEWRGEEERKYRFIPEKARPVSAYKVGSDGTVRVQNAPVMDEPDDEIPF
jgi:hypothetical protein